MPKLLSVKARKHYGANSIDLTIPASICKEYTISEGDLFLVNVVSEPDDPDKALILEYKRVFSRDSEKGKRKR